MPAHLGSKPDRDQQPLKLLPAAAGPVRFCRSQDDVGEIVQIEATLHVLERTLQGADRLSFGIVLRCDGQGLRRLRPRLGQSDLRAVLCALRALRRSVPPERSAFFAQSD